MTANHAVLQSLQVGRVERHDWPALGNHSERPWRTGYFKRPVAGPLRLGRLGMQGDEQADLEDHGGPHRAVLAYSAEHYPLWRDELGIPDMGPGGFGENFTVSGQDESTVCIGDVFTIGSARAQVASPRGPCSNISRRWERPELLKRVAATTRFGWYLRVLDEGDVEAGMDVLRVEHPYPGWSVARVFRLKVDPKLDPVAVATLAQCMELSPDWRARFAAHGVPLDGR